MKNILLRIYYNLTGRHIMHSCGAWTKGFGDDHKCPQDVVINELKFVRDLLYMLGSSHCGTGGVKTVEKRIEQIRQGYPYGRK